MEKEIKIVPPEGYEIDKEKSTFDCIKFKPIQNIRWRDDKNAKVDGYYICDGIINQCCAKMWNVSNAYHIFNTEKQAKSALAMARISQIMANDTRFGGTITDDEWKLTIDCKGKHTICREDGKIVCGFNYTIYHFLAFHTKEQRDLFLKENEDLVRDFLMIN